MSDSRADILALLEGGGGFTTSDIAHTLARDNPYLRGINRRMQSGAVRSWLRRLELDGYVRRMDDEQPIVWCKA